MKKLFNYLKSLFIKPEPTIKWVDLEPEIKPEPETELQALNRLHNEIMSSLTEIKRLRWHMHLAQTQSKMILGIKDTRLTQLEERIAELWVQYENSNYAWMTRYTKLAARDFQTR